MIKDLTGQRFGRLLVLYYHCNDKNNNAMWMCKCDCGTLKIIRGLGLTSGNTQSCGCLNRERSSAPKGQSIKVRLYHAIRHGALYKRKIEFTLNKEEFFDLVFSDCFYCGSSPQNVFEKLLLYNGIDRIDSSKGYISGNVVSCCKDCNHAKSEMSVQGFTKWIDKISKSSFFLLRKFGGSHVTLNQ